MQLAGWVLVVRSAHAEIQLVVHGMNEESSRRKCVIREEEEQEHY